MATMAQLAMQLARLQNARGESTPAERQEISRLLREQKRQEVHERKWLMSKRKKQARARHLRRQVDLARQQAANPQVSESEISEAYASLAADSGPRRATTQQAPSAQEVVQALRASKRAEVQARQAQAAIPKQPVDLPAGFQIVDAEGRAAIDAQAQQREAQIAARQEEMAGVGPSGFQQVLHTGTPGLGSPMEMLDAAEQPEVAPQPTQEMGADEVVAPVVTPEEEQGKVPHTDLSSLENAYGELQQASDQYAAAVDVQAQAEFEIRQTQHNRRLQEEELRRQSLAEADHELKDLRSEVRNFRINPNRLFPNTMSRLGAAISVAIGGFAEAYSGGRVRNTALDIINNAVQLDIEAQKSRMHAGKEAIRGAENAYGKLLQKFEREDLATKALEIQELELVSGKMKDLLVKAGITDKENPLSMFALKIQMQLKEKAMGFVKDRAQMKHQQGMQAQGLAQIMMTNEAAARKEAADQTAAIEEELNIEIPQDVQKKTAVYKESEPVWNLYLNLMTGIDKNKNKPRGFSLARLLDKGVQFVMPGWLNAGERSQVNYLREHLSVEFMRSKESGVMTDKDREFYRALFPSYKSAIFGPESAHFAITTMMAVKNRGLIASIDNQPPKVKRAIFRRNPSLRELYVSAKQPAVQEMLGYWERVQTANRQDAAAGMFGAKTEMPEPPRNMGALTSETLEYDNKRGIFVKKKP